MYIVAPTHLCQKGTAINDCVLRIKFYRLGKCPTVFQNWQHLDVTSLNFAESKFREMCWKPYYHISPSQMYIRTYKTLSIPHTKELGIHSHVCAHVAPYVSLYLFVIILQSIHEIITEFQYKNANDYSITSSGPTSVVCKI